MAASLTNVADDIGLAALTSFGDVTAVPTVASVGIVASIADYHFLCRNSPIPKLSDLLLRVLEVLL